jgi:membrane protein implicated in regulation of membrane protease activity
MTWADFYLICFVVGLAFSLLSLLAGGTDWHFHLPHFHAHVGGPHVHVGHGGAGHADGGQGAHLSPFNFVSATAFLAWFGGAGYLLTRYSGLWFAAALGIALLAGLAGAAVLFLFLGKVMISQEEIMDQADYEMVGVLGNVSSPIRAGGTGELIYSQAGTRRSCGVRAEDGTAIEKGTEVVVTRYERGIAYVRRWSEIAGDLHDELPAQDKNPHS